MNLIIDIGNSRIKTAIFHQGKLTYSAMIQQTQFVPSVQKIHAEFPEIKDLLVSHVGKMEKGWEKFLQENFKFFKLSSATPLPFKNLYKTPNTLGLDRIGLVAAAYHKFPDKNVLIIDAGTCVTYDILNDQGAYLGGGISPGIQMRLKALHTFTDKLPLLEVAEKVDLIGKTTFDGMQTGTVMGTALEIDGFIAHYRETFKNLTVILTGGDGLLLSKTIKNSIFAPSNFLLEGLNAILEYNKTS